MNWEKRSNPEGQPNLRPKVITTLLVPYTVDSTLQRTVQSAEDTFVSLVGGEKVRVVEKGGDALIDLLGCNNPWVACRSCGDPGCPTCWSRQWVKEKKKEALKSGTPLPGSLITVTSVQCHWEDLNYWAQCLTCLSLGRASTYKGESSRSGRQHHLKHENDLTQGVAESPLVVHTGDEHGGVRPVFIYTIGRVEPDLSTGLSGKASRLGHSLQALKI